MARTTLTMMVVAVALLTGTSAAAQSVVVVPEGYEVTHTAVPAPPANTASTALATPPQTQLRTPMAPETPPDHTQNAEPRTRANRGLVIAGIISLAAGYGANIVGSLLYSSLRAVSGVANTDEFLLTSFIPVAGPWVQLAFASSELEVGFLIGAGTLQAAGLTMLIAGLTVARRPVNEVALSDTSTIRIDPMLGGDAAGITASGTF